MLLPQEQFENPGRHDGIPMLKNLASENRQPQRPSDTARQLAPNTLQHDSKGAAIRDMLLNSGHHSLDIVLPEGGKLKNGDEGSPVGGGKLVVEEGTGIKDGHLVHHDSFEIDHKGQKG